MARDKAKHRDYMREYMKRKRDEAGEIGNCKRCITRPAMPGMKCCQKCLDDRYKYDW